MNILIATDGSPNAIACIEALKARPFAEDTTLHIISIYDTHDYHMLKEGLSIDEAKTAINNAIEKLQGFSYVISSEIIQGNPINKILEIAKARLPDMLFIGAHAKTSWRSPFLGNTAQAVIETCQCSVTVIKSGPDGNYRPEKKLLICVDSEAGNTDSWIYKKTHIWPSDGEFLVLNVVEPTIDLGSENPKIDAKIFLDSLNNRRLQMTQLVENEIAYLKGFFPYVQIKGQVIEAIDVVEGILNIAQSQQSDLIIMHPHLRKWTQRTS